MQGIDSSWLVDISKAAGKAILEIYNSDQFKTDAEIETKGDGSPLTRADRKSHEIIHAELSKRHPDIPVLSEEGKDLSWEERQSFKRYWLVDPLDGTKEFVKRNGEFTVNIALIDNGRPVLGVVHAPVLGFTYFGEREKGAFKESDNKKESITVKKARNTWKVVGSRSHPSDQLEDYLNALPCDEMEIVPMGSSLKFCLVAEGAADIYPRLGPTSEWDTAAAQAVVEAAGGVVINLENSKTLQYNSKESLLNPHFVVCAASTWNILKDLKQVYWHNMEVNKEARAKRFKQKPAIIWFTGLSGSGKSTSAGALEQKLFSMGYSTFLLDGDNVRHGLCSDLGFSDRDRVENIRRVGEVAKLLVDAGQIVLVSFISPFVRERKMVRQLVEPGEFLEVYVNTPLGECEFRDPKGLYKKARAGVIKEFTGIDSPYEAPEDPEIEIDTSAMTVEQVVEKLISGLKKQKIIK